MPLLAAIVIAMMVLAAAWPGRRSRARPISLNGIAGAAALTLWAMLGFESATIPARRVVNPERNIPRATIFGTLFAGLIYLTASVAVFLLLPASVAASSSAPFADLVGRYWGPTAGTLVVLFAVSLLPWRAQWLGVSCVGEIPASLAERGVFPRWFGKLNGARHAVARATARVGAVDRSHRRQFHRAG